MYKVLFVLNNVTMYQTTQYVYFLKIVLTIILKTSICYKRDDIKQT